MNDMVTTGKEIPYQARKKVKKPSKIVSTFKKVGSVFKNISDIDWEKVIKVLLVIGIFVGAGYVIYLLITNYKTIDTKVTAVTWTDSWYYDRTCTNESCDTDYYFKRSFKMDCENGMHVEFSDTKEVFSWDYRINPPQMRTFAVGDCVRLGGYDCPWGGFNVINVEKIGC